MLPFDAVITLNDHQLEAAGLATRKGVAVAAVREAVGRMDGAHWIDVEAETFPAWAAGVGHSVPMRAERSARYTGVAGAVGTG